MTEVLSPLAGRAVPLSAVPDPVFASELVGSGVAVEPPDTDAPVTVVAPVAGVIAKLHPHAAVIVTDSGAGVLVHVGIDTVHCPEVFTLRAAEGDTVAAGDPLVVFAPNAVRRANRSPIVPVVVMDTPPGSATAPAAGPVAPGDRLFTSS
ncbi:MAG: PTS glucose transporter subunit IIA [Mycobacteriaceae bacterium]|nr:PTS glucose transporter subunit IIA [Mycobacteriaceae bacterium]